MNDSQRAPAGRGFGQNLRQNLRQARAPAIAAALIAASLLTAAASFLAPADAPPAVAALATPGRAAGGGGSTLTLSYYPEQLAALNSLKQFEPMADGGRRMILPNVLTHPAPLPRPASFAASLAAPQPDGKPHRAAARIGAIAGLTAEPAAMAPPAILAATSPTTEGAQMFGVRLPALSMPTVSLPPLSLPALPGVEAASANLAGFGAQVAKLWR